MEDNLELTKQAWKKHGKKKNSDVFPRYYKRLPKLLQFCGTYSMGRGMPDWWEELISEIKEKWGGQSPIAELFQSATIEEFRQGLFQSERHKKYRRQLPMGQEKKIISSPRIAKFLKEQFGVRHQFTVAFHDRGAKHPEKEIVITADPWDIINMSTRGKSWSSCQNFIEYPDCEVWSNLKDPCMAVIFARTKGDKSEKNVDTKVILRYVQTNWDKSRNSLKGVLIDKFYGDAAYVAGIQKLILRLCRKYGLCLFECKDYNLHKLDGYRINQKKEYFFVYGPLINFGRGDYSQPYLDNACWNEEKVGLYQLETEVCVIFNPAEPNTAAK